MRGGPALVVGAIIVRDDCLLLIERGNAPEAGRWAPPGGAIEMGETIQEAVVREVAEETGLAGVCGPLVGWVERFSDDYHYVILDFEVTLLDDEEPVAGDDAVEVAWVPLREVAEWRLVEGLAEFLHDHDIISTYC
ncbi:MAG TPA: NUDIX domain-containing protein [Acidimicrobiales bacterium]|nr:NUDIX domain-containing protein [Acidimicrobiales bacterium]